MLITKSNMTLDQLKEVMKFQLKAFNQNGVGIIDETIHKDILSEDDGFATANSKEIYRSFVRYTLVKNGHLDRPWPDAWMNLSVNILASKII
jgi:hypothetical protein